MKKPIKPEKAVIVGDGFITPEEIIKNITDDVNHPSHYETGKYECIGVMGEVFGKDALQDYCLIASFKYLYRCKRKENLLKDIKKCIWYLNKYVELEEGDQGE